LGYGHVYARRGASVARSGKADGCVIAWRQSMFTMIPASHRIVDYNQLCHLCGGSSAYGDGPHPNPHHHHHHSGSHHSHRHHHNHNKGRSKEGMEVSMMVRALRNRFLRHNLGHYLLLRCNHYSCSLLDHVN
jgi:G3E family GTPase